MIEGYYKALKPATNLTGAAIDLDLVSYSSGVVNS